MRSARAGVVSLDARLGSDGDSSLGDLLCDEMTPAPDAALEAEDERRSARDAVLALSERERRVLELRFGIGADTPRTLREVGRHLGLTRERIRQIEKQAVEKLRRRLERPPLRRSRGTDLDPRRAT